MLVSPQDSRARFHVPSKQSTIPLQWCTNILKQEPQLTETPSSVKDATRHALNVVGCALLPFWTGCRRMLG